MIYFDHNATTPMDPEVLDRYTQVAREIWGNPSSIHKPGRLAFAELERSRTTVADLLGVSPAEVFFTSGGTESNNLALHGILSDPRGKHVITSTVEHPAVDLVCEELVRRGSRVTRVPVDTTGILNLEEYDRALNEGADLVTVMYANNEIGTVQPIEEVAGRAAQRNVPVHTDAVQALGKIPVNANFAGIGMISFSSHKVYGPKGVGALIIKENTPVRPLLVGGGQERGRRSGTENVPGISAFAYAVEKALCRQEEEASRLFSLTEHLYSLIIRDLVGVTRNGDPLKRLPGTLNLSLSGITSEMLIPALDQRGIAASGGAACSSGATKPSRVLEAIGCNRRETISAVRFSLGRWNTRQEVEEAASAIVGACRHIRAVTG